MYKHWKHFLKLDTKSLPPLTMCANTLTSEELKHLMSLTKAYHCLMWNLTQHHKYTSGFDIDMLVIQMMQFQVE